MNNHNTVWAVVHVWRGIPSKVVLFATEKLAKAHEFDLRMHIPPEDEVGVFEVQIPLSEVR